MKVKEILLFLPVYATLTPNTIQAGVSQSGLGASLLQRASPIHIPPEVYHHHQSAIMKKNCQLLRLPAISSINKSSGSTLRYKRPQTFSQ